MPHTDQESRKVFDYHIDALSLFLHSPGDYNYVITRLIHDKEQKAIQNGPISELDAE